MDDLPQFQDNHRCVTQCIDNICKCTEDKKDIGNKLQQTVMNSPISKTKLQEIARTKSGS